VLTAGRPDHDKWCFFVERGDLVATAVHDPGWLALEELSSSQHAPALRAVLSPIWQNERSRGGCLASILIVSTWLALSLIVVPIMPTLWRWMWLLALVLTVVVLIIKTQRGPRPSPYRDAAAVLTRLAQNDPEFFRFALERRLMQIAPSWALEGS
jgi:hypothetical protein